ncbi:MAG: hypothetical protein ABJC12_05820, partial [Saprospiraceae bacterium]
MKNNLSSASLSIQSHHPMQAHTTIGNSQLKKMKGAFPKWMMCVSLFVVMMMSGGVSWGQFTAGNLVVNQVGDGSTALTAAATTVKLLQFTTSGTTQTGTAFFGSTGTPTNSPYNLVESGTATSNGYLSLSVDKAFIVVPGYNAPNGQASIAGSASATFGRTIGKAIPAGTIQANGTFNTLTGNNYRSVVSNGSGYWLSGGIGVVYTSSDITTGIATTATTIGSTNTRVLNIFNNTLCYSTGSGTLGIYFLGTFNTLPTTSASATLIIATGTGSSPYGVAFSPNALTCYVADDRASAAGGIQKWTYSGVFSATTGWSGGTWTLAYTLGTGVASVGARGLTVDFSGANPIIYGTSSETTLNRVFKITDTGSGSLASTLATATTNFIFRGIAFAPVSAACTPPTVSITNNTGTTILTCSTTSISVTATGGTSYSWSGGATPSTAANSFSTVGTYTVTVTDANSCTNTSSITITSNTTPPTAGITNNTGSTILTCTTTSISVTATGGVSYSWDGGSTPTTAANSFSTPGTYTVTVTGSNGCTSTASVTIAQDITPPTAGITNNTGSTVLTCSTTSISVTATGGGTYAWDGGSTPTTAANSFSTPGTYMVTVTGSNGCTSTASVTITQDITPPTAGITNNTGSTVLTCTTTSISVTATGGGTYAWDGGSTPTTAA